MRLDNALLGSSTALAVLLEIILNAYSAIRILVNAPLEFLTDLIVKLQELNVCLQKHPATAKACVLRQKIATVLAAQ